MYKICWRKWESSDTVTMILTKYLFLYLALYESNHTGQLIILFILFDIWLPPGLLLVLDCIYIHVFLPSSHVCFIALVWLPSHCKNLWCLLLCQNVWITVKLLYPLNLVHLCSTLDHNVCFAQHKLTNCIKLTTLILLVYIFLLFYIALIVLDTECYYFILHLLY